MTTKSRPASVGVVTRLIHETMRVGAFELAPTALLVHGRPTFEEWVRLGDYLRLVNQGCQWWWGDWLRYGESRDDWTERWAQAVEASGYEAATLETLKLISEKVPSRLRNRNVSFHVHKVAASLAYVDQREFLSRAEMGGWTVGEARAELRMFKRRPIEPAGPLVGTFRVVYADPPWQYDDRGAITDTGQYGRAESHYPSMSLEAICAIDLQPHLTTDAVLFLWCTEPFRFPVGRVIEAWGFVHKSAIIWDKVLHNFGHYVSVRHEHLLIATRGSCTPDHPTPMPDSVMTIRRSDVHSEKPEDFRRLIERLYDGPRLELFGRASDVPGWTIWGNQVGLVTNGS